SILLKIRCASNYSIAIDQSGELYAYFASSRCQPAWRLLCFAPADESGRRGLEEEQRRRQGDLQGSRGKSTSLRRSAVDCSSVLHAGSAQTGAAGGDQCL